MSRSNGDAPPRGRAWLEHRAQWYEREAEEALGGTAGPVYALLAIAIRLELLDWALGEHAEEVATNMPCP